MRTAALLPCPLGPDRRAQVWLRARREVSKLPYGGKARACLLRRGLAIIYGQTPKAVTADDADTASEMHRRAVSIWLLASATPPPPDSASLRRIAGYLMSRANQLEAAQPQLQPAGTVSIVALLGPR